MPIHLTAGVMTHPSRKDNALRVIRSQGDLAVELVEDPVPHGRPGAARTAQRAWEAMPDASTHHLLLQDDIMATKGLARHLADVIAQVPDAPLCLFTEWASRTAQAVRLSVLEGHGLVEVVDRLHTTQGVVLPAGIVRDFTAHLRGSGIDMVNAVADADLLFEFLRAEGHTVYVTAPNLVEHIELPSLLTNDILRGPRQSPCFDPSLPPRAWSVEPAGRAAVIPHMSTDGRSYCHRRDGGGWSSGQTVDWLAELGVPLPHLFASFRSELAALPQAHQVRAAVADPLVFQLWLTALASGQVMRAERGCDRAALAAAMAEPTAELAWSTLVPGALRKTLPVELGHTLGRALKPMLTRALLDAAGLFEG
ncbi:hypothetical protein ABT301_36415 [Streptomyces sp. NPDC000987]|uniref:hypothetical protein n=1 Tax=Streptomyces sp. NPDC000987 TaxID=3154374 RepID=UPI0033216006